MKKIIGFKFYDKDTLINMKLVRYYDDMIDCKDGTSYLLFRAGCEYKLIEYDTHNTLPYGFGNNTIEIRTNSNPKMGEFIYEEET